MIKKILSVSASIALLSSAVFAYDYSVLNLQDRYSTIHNLIDSKLSAGSVTFDDFSDELKEMLGGNVGDITIDGEALKIHYNDGTSRVVEIERNFLEKGEIISDTMFLKMNTGEVAKVSLNPLMDYFDSKLHDLRESFSSELEERKVKNVYIDSLTKEIVVAFTDNTTSRFSIANLIPSDTHTQSGEVSIGDKALTFTLTDGSSFGVDLSPLFEQRTTLLKGKVNKVDGKRLSTNDFNNKFKEMVKKRKMAKLYLDNSAKDLIVTYTDDTTDTIDLSTILEFDENHARSGRLSLGGKSIILNMKDGSEISIDIERIYDAIDGKVTAVENMTLSHNDFTNAYVDKVNSIKVASTSYDASSNKLTVTYTNGAVDTSVITGTAVTNYVTSGSFDGASKKLELTLLTGQVVTVDMTDVAVEEKTTKEVTLAGNNKLEIKYTDGTNSFVQLTDLFMSGADFDSASNKITLTKDDGTSLTVDLSASFDKKVDAVPDMGLSANDYTDADKALVQTINDKVSKDPNKDLSTNDFTDELKAMVEAKKVIGITRSGTILTIFYSDGTSEEIQ